MTTHKLHEKAVNHWLAGIASFLLLPCFASLAWLLFAFHPAVSIVCGLAFYCYFQREYPLLAVTSRAADIRDAFFIIPYGFISLVVMITKGCFKHGINPFRK